jgi:hypothetical protein
LVLEEDSTVIEVLSGDVFDSGDQRLDSGRTPGEPQ